MDRRREERRPRRFPVRFWDRDDDDEPRRGYVTNISTGGAYVATGRPLSSQTRVRLEIGEVPDDFAIEGVVAHSKRLAPELRMIGLSGMGVRFFSVREVIGRLLGGGADEAGANASARSGELDATEAGDGVYRLRFGSPEQFLQVARTDFVHGGLFVPTRHPAALDRRITVEVELPVPGMHPVRLPARVVQRIEPASEGGKPNRLAGMGVQLEDLEGARKAFLPALDALEGRERR